MTKRATSAKKAGSLYIWAVSAAAIKHPKSNGLGVPKRTNLEHIALVAVGRDEEHVKELMQPITEKMFPRQDGYGEPSIYVTQVAPAMPGHRPGVRVPV